MMLKTKSWSELDRYRERDYVEGSKVGGVVRCRGSLLAGATSSTGTAHPLVSEASTVATAYKYVFI